MFFIRIAAIEKGYFLPLSPALGTVRKYINRISYSRKQGALTYNL